MAQDGGKVVSLMHRLPLPPGNAHFCYRLRSFASISSIFFSILLLIILATIFAEQTMRLFHYSPHAVRVSSSNWTG
jgi:TctA family transporter